MTTASQVLPPAVPGHDPSFPGQRYDLSAALEHMEKAGFPFDPVTRTGGYPEPVTFLGPADSAVIENFAPIMQQQVARIGIRMEIKQLSFAAYLAETSKRHRVQLGRDAWSMDFPDPSDFFEPVFSSQAIQEEETQNRAFFSNPELDDLLAKAHRELDAGLRASMYRRCEEIVRDHVPWALGYYQRWYELVQPYVHNYVVDKKHTEDMREVWIDAGERKRTRRSQRASAVLSSIRPWATR